VSVAIHGRFTDMRFRFSRVLKVVVGILLSIGLGWLAVRGIDWILVGEKFAEISITSLIAAIMFFISAGWVRAIRWRMLFVEDKISINRLFIVQNEGVGINNVLPFRIASELTQFAVLVLKDGINRSTVFASLLIERLIDLLASMTVLFLAILFVPEMGRFTPFVSVVFAFSILAAALLIMFMWCIEKIAVVRKIKFITSLSDAIRIFEKKKSRVICSIVLSVVYWLMVGVTAWIVAEAIDLPISPVTTTLVVMGTIFFATVVPAAPSALGTFEFAVVSVLDYFGIDRSEGFSFAVIIHVIFFLPPTIIAAIFLPREGILTFKNWRSGMMARKSNE